MNFKKRVNGSWVDTPNYIHKTDTDTITTLPAELYPNAETATVGLKGNMVQNGTPTPTTPIQPSECGEMSANLWGDSSTISKGKSPSYYTATLEMPLPTGTYTFSAKVIAEEGVTACRVSFRNSNMGQIVPSNINVSAERTSITVTLNEPCYAVYMYGYNDTTTLSAVTYQDIMLNIGSTILPYEPYGYKAPISSASTTTPVYLGEVQTTRKIKKLVLTGEETSWQSVSASEGRNRFTLPILNAMQADTAHFTSLSTHLPLGVEGATWNTDDVYTIVSSKLYIRLTAQYNTLADFKTYLQQQYAAGTPVTVWYVLATKTTGIVNEPIRKIGGYADTVSGITIPTTTGADSFDVLTTLKPSEVELTYTGWHDASVGEWDGSEWQ